MEILNSAGVSRTGLSELIPEGNAMLWFPRMPQPPEMRLSGTLGRPMGAAAYGSEDATNVQDPVASNDKH